MADNKFRSLEEVKRYLDEQQKQLREDFQLVDENLKQLRSMTKAAIVKATEFKILDISGNGASKKRKKTLNVDFPVVKVPNKDKLGKSYKMAEALSQKYKELLQNENSIRMTFRNASSKTFEQLMGTMSKFKKELEDKMKELFAELNAVAEGHAPKEYKEFVASIAEELDSNQHIECESSRTFTYVALDNDGDLVFAGYIVLNNAISDEGKEIPHLYITVRWTVGGDVEIFVEHDFVEPTLLNGGTVVENLKDATKAIVNQLSLEGFSSQIGNLPIGMQLRTPAGGMTPDAFSAAPFVDKIESLPEELVFHLKKGTTHSQLENIKYQLFLEVKALLKHKRKANAKMRMQNNAIHFTIVGLDNSGGIHPHDLEWLSDKYKLNQTQLRKIANEINEGGDEA